MCVGGVLTTELLSVNITIRAVQRSSRGGSPGGGGWGGGKRREKRRVRDRGKAFCMHYRSPGLAGGALTRLYEGSLNQSIVIVHAQFTVLAEKRNPSPHKRDSRWLTDQGRRRETGEGENRNGDKEKGTGGCR